MHDMLRPGTTVGIYVTWHRSEVDGLDHAVTDEEFARGRDDDLGQYEGLCGHVLLPFSMLVPPGRPCGRCKAYLSARSTLSTINQRLRAPQHRMPSRLRRLFRRSPGAGARRLCARHLPSTARTRGLPASSAALRTTELPRGES